jgi:outer membrane protein insertion porin family
MPACAWCAFRSIFVICGLVSLLPQAVLGEAATFEGKKVARILFVPREQPLEPDEIHNILAVKEQAPLKLEEVRAAIDRLYATGVYADIQVDAEIINDQVVLRFITQNNWFIGRVGVEGEIKEPPNAQQLIAATRLELGEVESEEKIRQAENGIQQAFESNGFYLSNAQPKFAYDPRTTQVLVTFLVESGHRAKYSRPDILGEPVIPIEKIISATHWKGWFGWHKVTQRRTQRGIQNVRKLYQKQDRLMARVTLEKMDFDQDALSVLPTLRIRAGPKVSVNVIGAKLARDKLQRLVPIFEEHTVDRDLLVEGQRNLRDYFQSQGYFEVEVEFKPQRIINDRANIDYLVNLGKRHKLVKVEITGNRYFDTKTIRERMYIEPASLQFRRGRYSESYLRRDEQAITSLYQENGFRDVKVTSIVQDDYRGKVGAIAVTIEIDEGQQWLISKLEVEGIRSLDRDRIIASLASTVGQPFSEFNVAVDRDNILSEYFNEGFPNATFEWSSSPAPQPYRVELKYVITEGERRFVRQVLTSGLHITQDRIVNRQILLNPGDPLSQPKMVETQRRLYDLGIFSAVNMAIQNQQGETQKKYVLYQMDEAKRYSISTGFGAEFARIGGGTNLNYPAGKAGFSPRVSFDITRLNFRGLGQTLSLRTRLSNFDKLALGSFTAPRIRDNPNLTLTLTALYRDSRDVRTFDSKRVEGAIQLSQKVSKAVTVIYGFSYRRVSVTGLAIDPLLIPTFSQPVRIGLASVSLIQDRRDNPTDPRRGVFNTANLGLSSKIFGSQSAFTTFLGRNTTYHPLSKNLVFARSLNFGYLRPITRNLTTSINPGDIFSGVSSEQIPIAERFFSGGGNSHRGFPENQAGPRDASTGFPVGGQALLIFNHELRFPLFGTTLGGVLFLDSGNVYTRIQDISFRLSQPHQTRVIPVNGVPTAQELFGFNYMVQAAGFGIRYRTPIGPVRLDLAFSPNSPRFEGCAGLSGNQILQCGLLNPNGTPVVPPTRDRINRFQFHFSIGQAF